MGVLEIIIVTSLGSYSHIAHNHRVNLKSHKLSEMNILHAGDYINRYCISSHAGRSVEVMFSKTIDKINLL
jgi:hypothetical protein